MPGALRPGEQPFPIQGVLLAGLVEAHAKDPWIDTLVLGCKTVRALEADGGRLEQLRELARGLDLTVLFVDDALSNGVYLTNLAVFEKRGRTFPRKVTGWTPPS
jgi:hypothetical protein